MAKKGFQYYSVETDRYRDKKIRKLKRDCGCNGIAVYDFLLCEIYRVEGYFLEWDDSTAFDVADYFGLKETQVNEYVNYCCVVGLFDRELYTSERVLTSRAIQLRFIDWSKKAKRTNIEILEKHKILPEKKSILPEETKIVQEDLEQSKVKENKEEEREVLRPPEENSELQNNQANPPPVAPPPSISNGPPIEEVKMFFSGAGGTDEMAMAFWNKWEGLGWAQNNTKIKNWRPFGNNFIATWYRNEKEKKHGSSTGRQSVSGSIEGINAAFADIQRDLDASMCGGSENTGD